MVNYALLALTTAIFALQLLAGEDGGGLVEGYAMYPARVFKPEGRIVVPQEVLVETPLGRQRLKLELEVPLATIPPWLTLLTCIFLHGGWLHFLGNMWILYIFGDNVEDRFGHLGYLIFYLLGGVAASLTHLFTNSDSPVPTLGASGAIAGVMGAYLRLYPRARVHTLIPVLFFYHLVDLPAPIFLGVWFLLQLFQGTLAIGSTQGGGVAWWAHIGGFAAGFVVASFLAGRRVSRPRVEVYYNQQER